MSEEVNFKKPRNRAKTVDLEVGLPEENAPLLPPAHTHTTLVQDVDPPPDTRLHEAVLAQDLDSIRALLASGASPAALNADGMTPLHLCVHWKLLRPFQLLLNAHEGAAQIRDVNGWPVLAVAVAHGWAAGACAALLAGADFSRYSDDWARETSARSSLYPHMPPLEPWDIFDQTPVHLAVIVGGTAMLDKILAYADRDAVVNCVNRYGETPLNKAIYNGNLAAVQVLLRRGASVNKVTRTNNTALHVAADQPRIMEYILENTDVANSVNSNGFTALHVAVCRNSPRCVEMLLGKFNDIDRKTEGKAWNVLHLAAQYASNDAAQVILDRDPQAKLLTTINNDGDAPLHIAVDNNNRTLAALYLRKGAMLSAKGRDGKTAIEKIVTTFHDASIFIELIFNECINYHPEREDVVVVDYQKLTRSPDMSQIQFLGELTRCGQSNMLVHPLIESLLYLKWRRLLPLFFMAMVGYLTFLTSFTYFVLDKFYDRDTKSTGSHWYSVEIDNVFCSSFLVLLTEGFNIYGKRLRYFLQIESMGKVMCLVLVLTASCALKYGEPTDGQRHVACAALLLTWLQAMYLVSRFFQWGYYAHMLRQVAINILKIMATVIFPVVGFAFCFMIQYRSTSPFSDPFVAIVKTLVMMTSEFDYEGLFNLENHKELEKTHVAVRLLFVSFVVFVAIVLMNFMTGIAVSDIHELNLRGRIWRLEQQLEQLSTMDYAFTFGGSRYHDAIYYELKGHDRGNIVCYSVHQNTFEANVFSKWFYLFMNYQTFPSTLHNALVYTAKKKKEQYEEDTVKTQYRRKVDALYDAIVGKAAIDHQRNRREDRDDPDTRRYETRFKLDEQIVSLSNGLSDVNIKMNQLASDISSMKEMLAIIAKRCVIANRQAESST